MQSLNKSEKLDNIYFDRPKLAKLRNAQKKQKDENGVNKTRFNRNDNDGLEGLDDALNNNGDPSKENKDLNQYLV